MSAEDKMHDMMGNSHQEKLNHHIKHRLLDGSEIDLGVI
jgi:hypothetical protein